MPKAESSPRNSRSEPLLTIHVHRGAGVFILVLGVVSLGVFLFARVWTRDPQAVDRPQTTVEQRSTATITPPASLPSAKPEESGWKKSWKRESASPQSVEERVPEPSDDQDLYNSSEQASAEVEQPQPVAENQALSTSQSARDPEPPSQEATSDEPPTVPARVINLPDEAITLHGAGASFPYPLYATWSDKFHELHPQVTINYQSNGSGAGIRLVSEGRVDFGATDEPLSDQQLQQIKSPVMHIPTVLGAVTPIYNIFGVSQEIRFTPEILAGIFLGKIRYWDDETILRANPGIRFPNAPITVVHRSDGSQATFILTDYLSKVSREWNDKVGKGVSVPWPTGLGSQGDEAVAMTVREIDGAIGYVELIIALQNKIPFGSVRNRAGKFVKASIDSLTVAAASADLPADFRASITDAPGDKAYPIAGFTWLLIPERLEDQTKSRDLVEFLRWMIRDGQSMASSLGYAPLPKNVAVKVRQKIAQMREKQ